MSWTEMPKFADLPGASLPVKPPFPFEGMSARMFPLRASLGSLQRLVDSYLNIIPKELGWFRVPAPYVQLMILDYGRMSIEIGNYGWLAQREILFNVPLEWYQLVNGKYVFKDWASFSPYIYVDDDISMTTGRTVYGWPKTTASLEAADSDWVRNAQAPVTEARIKTAVFSELYSAKRLEMQTLLEVEREAPISHLRLPFDASQPFAPWNVAAKMANAVAGMSRDVVGIMAGLGVLPTHPGASADNYLAMMNKMATMAFPPKPNLYANTMNLKQFRRAENPDEYCYQALTNGPMRFTGFNGGGLLGEERLMAGDLSGGYSVVMHRWPSLPIVQTLGLEVEKQWAGTGCDIAVLKPVMPLWYNVDMVYEPGENIAWRSHSGEWVDNSGRTYPLTVDQTPKVAKLFNTSLGAANRTIAGAFHFADTTVRVMPLLAERAKLQQFLDSTFNEALADGAAERNGARLSLWSPSTAGDFAHVYLTATNFGDVTSTNDNIGDWAEYELSFLIPVRREEQVAGRWVLKGVGVVPAFTFVDNPTATAANTEVLGIPTTNAQFHVPDNLWMSHDGPAEESTQPLLKLEAEVIPVLGRGEKAVRRTLLEIEEGRAVELSDELEWRAIADTWGNLLKTELRRKQALRGRIKPDVAPTDTDISDDSHGMLDEGRRLALELLGNGMPISYYTMKQYRDVASPERACYQSLVRVKRTLSEVFDLREIEQPLTVRIHEYPTQPIVQMLGLVARKLTTSEPGIVYGLQPQRPFWMSVTLDESLGENFGYRAGEYGWRTTGESRPTYLNDVSTARRVGDSAVEMLDQGDARRLSRAAQEGAFASEPLSAQYLVLPSDLGDAAAASEQREPIEASKALTALDPQSVLESVLSREWGNWSENARWRQERRRLEARLEARLAGVAKPSVATIENEFFDSIVEEIGRRPGEPRMRKASSMVASARDFTQKWSEMEKCWEALADLVHNSHPVTQLAPGAKPISVAELAHARLAFLETVAAIGSQQVLGVADAPNKPADYHPSSVHASDARVRLLKMVHDEYAALEGVLGLMPDASEHRHADAETEAELKARADIDRTTRATLEQRVSLLQRSEEQLRSAPTTAADEGTSSDALRSTKGSTATTDADSLLDSQSLDMLMQRVRHDMLARLDIMKDLVRLARDRAGMQREALFNELARTAQKPDYAIWRGATGTESDRIFPMAQSWDESWYVGADAPPPSESDKPISSLASRGDLAIG